MSLRRLLRRPRLAALVILLGATTAGTAVATSYVARTATVAIEVNESIASRDAAGAVPPTGAAANESVHVGDVATVLGPVSITVQESIATGDSAGAVPPTGARVDEAVHVADAASVLGPVSLSDPESIAVSDSVLVVPAPKVESAESIGVTDQVSVQILAAPTEVTLASSNAATLLGTAATVDVHVASGAHNVTSGSVTLQEGNTVLAGPAALDSTGRAQLTTSSLTLGAHSLDVLYSGATGFARSSATISHGVYDYALSVAPADRTTLRGRSTSFDATVTLTPGSETSGLSPSVSLGVNGAPADATLTIPSTITVPSVAGMSATVTIGVATGAYSLGDYALVVAAGARSAVTRLHIYDYSLALSPPSQTVQRGSAVSYAVTASLVPTSSTSGVPAPLVLRTFAPPGISPSVQQVDLPGQAAVNVTTSETATPGVNSFTVQSADGSRSATADLFVNVAPVPSAGGPYAVDEGSSIILSASATDADKDALSFAWDLDGSGTFATVGSSVSFHAVDGPATASPRVRVCDDHGACAVATAVVTIANVAPTVHISTPASGAIVLARSPVSFVGSFTDPGTLDTHTVRWSFGATALTATYAFPAAGLQTVTLTVTDKDGGVGTASVNLVVVDPAAGSVEGEGWFRTVTGRTTFNFDAGYEDQGDRRGVRLGGEVKLKTPSGRFRSTSFRYLVVAGSTFELDGTGALNGGRGYSFHLSGVVGRPDRLRVQIGGVYDSGGPVALGGGKIKIDR